MASRSVFLPNFNGRGLAHERRFDFPWAAGFSAAQKKKNIISLHKEARRNGIGRVLEISSKSSERVGQRLSAFSLKVTVSGKEYCMESVYQGSKVFERGGPFVELYDKPPREAKRFMRSCDCGRLTGFELEGRRYPLRPKNAFYDWLYIRALVGHADWIGANIQYDAFTDIEFNPAKQVNCQARAFAEYLSLLKSARLQDAAADFETFAEMLQSA